MAKEYARFAAAPIGPSLVASDNGLTLTTLANGLSLSRMAISDVSHNSGAHGAEFTFWGDDPLSAAIGVAQPTAPLNAMVGANNLSVGWKLATGEVFVNNAVVANGLPVPVKGDIVGLRVLLDAGTLEFYRGATLVHSRALGAATYHFAVSLASTVAGQLTCAVNAGQWQGRSNAVLGGGWQPAAAAVTTVRLADLDYLTAPTDNPANARYEGLLDQAGIVTAAALGFWPWGGERPMQGGAARVRVLDADGVLDTLAQTDVAGVPVALRLGDADGTLAASSPVARMICSGIEVESDSYKVIHLADAHDDLDEPLTRGVFLPSIPSLAWRVQPVVIGAVASIPALPANSDGSVAFLADAPLASVSAVLDRGDAMEAGTWMLDPSNQQLLLESPPVGPVAVDASSIGAAMQPAKLEQALREIFRRIGKTAWSVADAQAIDAATGYAGIGYYAGDAISVRQALAAILPSYGAWWWQDDDGVLRFARVIDPDTVADGALAFDLTADDRVDDIKMIPDEAPNLTRRMAYRPNAFVHGAADLVTDMVGVPPAKREELTSLWRALVYSARKLAPRYAHADGAAPFVSCFWNAADASAEINRVLAMYAVPCYFYLWPHQDAALAPKPGQVGRITYPRYGLEAGRKVLVRGRQRNPITGELLLDLWGK